MFWALVPVHYGSLRVVSNPVFVNCRVKVVLKCRNGMMVFRIGGIELTTFGVDKI